MTSDPPRSDEPPIWKHSSVLDSSDSSLFPIVGIGASAGGLAALKQFFEQVPGDTGFAFVVVVHLSPDHDSHLPEILQSHIGLKVQQVQKTIPLKPDNVYIIPPNANLDTIDTHLRLTELEERPRERAPIDHFFRTLADTHGSHAVGVVLTGTGSDGTLGLRRIKERGGLVVVQDPGEAEYDGMPQSAISATPVDLILPVAEMPKAILDFVRTHPELAVPSDQEADSPPSRFLQQVFELIQARTGRDFTNYKRSTLLRRISRRMQFNHIQQPFDYLELLRKQPEEVRSLADELLITVTSFFREPDVFEALAREVIPHLFAGKGREDSVRVWSVGCATGEEAYSLAILLLEAAADIESAPAIQVFASDLHPRSLQQARDGFYPGDIEADVTPERLRRFFQKEDSGYRVRKEVREMVIFAPHNILTDPPFSKLNLISCRNLLIYLQRELQRQVTKLFHYALQVEGFLVLGTSETVDTSTLFQTLDKKRCIYRRRNIPRQGTRLPVFPLTRSRPAGAPEQHATSMSRRTSYGQLHHALVELHGPPSVLVSPDDHVVHFSENAGRYLIHPGGSPTTQVYKLVREELGLELSTAMSRARVQKERTQTKPTEVTINGEQSLVVLDLQPAMDAEYAGFVLIIFDDRPLMEVPSRAAWDEQDTEQGGKSAEIKRLQEDKGIAEKRMQQIIEQYEANQEEVRASNEELQSANEELRSTLEELETSKEELQSMNEELQTVNQENRYKVQQLTELSSDLQNLLAATDIATLFLDRQLRILRFTPKITELFNVRVADRGRPLSDFTHRLGYDNIQEDARRVLDHLLPIEREVADQSGNCYLTRVLPYRTGDDRIVGAVVTFVDITQRKAIEQELRKAKDYAENIMETFPVPLLVLSSDLRVRSANVAFYEHFNEDPESACGRWIYELGNGQWNIPSLRELLENVLPHDHQFRSYRVEHEFKELGRRIMLLNGQRLDDQQLILLGIHDVTDRELTES